MRLFTSRSALKYDSRSLKEVLTGDFEVSLMYFFAAFFASLSFLSLLSERASRIFFVVVHLSREIFESGVDKG